MPQPPGKPERSESTPLVPRKKRRIMVTLDVEAFELRAKKDPLEKLIWGQFPEGEFGLRRILSIAEARGIKLTTFLDYPEYYAYGESLLDVGREITRRGHDLNLHLHLDCIPSDYFAKRGLPSGLDLNTFTRDVADACVSDVMELHGRVSSQPPTALRGGGYRYNAELLRALAAAGVPMSSNYNPAAKLQPFDLGLRRQFRWETGTLELPVATQTGFLGRAYPIHFNFNIGLFMGDDEAAAVANSEAFLERFYEQHGEDAVAVFVLHSWSFLRMDAAGEFSIVNPAAPDRLAAFLSAWSKSAEFVTARDVAELARDGRLSFDGPLTIPALQIPRDSDRMTSPPTVLEAVREASRCPICATSTSEFVDYNGPKRQCPSCGSTERQRAFADIYPTFIKPEFDLRGKDVLIAAPGNPEKRFLKAQGVRWWSLDVRPEVKPDFVADLCDLSSIADGSFDAIVASFVLTCVHDLNACLSELHRVLRPGGRLMTCDPMRFGVATTEHENLEQITSWYGREAYDKYRIGSFRTFGDLDLIRSLQRPGFLVKTVYWLDPATRTRWVWHISTKAGILPCVQGRVAGAAPLAPSVTPDETSVTSVATARGSGTSELHRLRQRVTELELELQSRRRASASLALEADKVKDTLSFQLGHLLLHAPKSWAGIRRLPSQLLGLHREAKRRRGGRRTKQSERGATMKQLPRRPQDFAEDVFAVFLADGLKGAITFAEAGAQGERELAFALTRLGKLVASTEPHVSVELARRAYALEPSPFRAKWLAFLQYKCGEVMAPAALLASLPADFELKPAEHERVVEILGLGKLRAEQIRIPPARPRAYEPVQDSCLYVTGSALPFHVAGYTVRSHALIRAIAGAGFQVTAALRPGYPGDRGVATSARTHQVDDITYLHLPGPHVRRMGPQEFAEAAATELQKLAERVRPQLIHAASNHVNALPALIAARRLGLPFVYEVRGMWELTAATRNVNWEQTERFEQQRELETLVAREADQVLTLTEGLAGELVARGVARERISIVPNCVDPAQFVERQRDPGVVARFGVAESAFTLVYAGSLLHYEGLDDVLRALAILIAEGIAAMFLVAGEGEASELLRRLASELNIAQSVRFLGRLAPDEIPALWAVADAAVFARKPFRVCDLVSPLKPLEPMAMGIPVVVSDVAALREMVRHAETGLVHRAGDFEDLALQLRELVRDPSKRKALAQAARQAVLRERTWDRAGDTVAEVYRRLNGARDVDARASSRRDL
jgi:glycosyltransferase involved in cell wall biosynthesis/SAM-dependent methyltransferase